MGAMRERESEQTKGADARPTYEELAAENRRLKSQVRELKEEVQESKARVQGLRAQVQELQLLVEKCRRDSKRQAAPFRKQEQPAAEPKKPGRKSGRRHGTHRRRAIPPRIDATYDVPLPPECPHCGDHHLRKTHVAPQYQTEIPRTVIYRRFDVQAGVCDGCGRAVQGRHALQTSAARGAAASQLGPNIHAALTIMNKQLGLSHGKCVKLLSTLFEGLSIARGTSARSIARTGGRCQPAYEQLRRDIGT
jgi:transposase